MPHQGYMSVGGKRRKPNLVASTAKAMAAPAGGAPPLVPKDIFGARSNGSEAGFEAGSEGTGTAQERRRLAKKARSTGKAPPTYPGTTPLFSKTCPSTPVASFGGVGVGLNSAGTQAQPQPPVPARRARRF